MKAMTEAIVFREPCKVELLDIVVPDLGPTDVGVRTVYSGISSGTERWTLTGRYNRWGEKVAEYYPHIPGYQRSGVVEGVGPEVKGIRPGDKVICWTYAAKVEHLEKRRSWWLGHIGYAVTPQEFVWKLGATADLEEAAFWAMAATGAHGVRLIGVRPGELVVVIGQGLIGQMSAQMARLRGATVIATDMIQKRVDLSVLHSADVAINGRKESLLEVVREYQPEGADVVIDTSGDSRMFDFLLELIREEGRICLQGYYPDPFRIEFHPTHKKRATVAFPCGNEDSAKIVPLLNQHKVRLKPLITHRFRARQAKEAYDLVLNRPEESLGILLEWT